MSLPHAATPRRRRGCSPAHLLLALLALARPAGAQERDSGPPPAPAPSLTLRALLHLEHVSGEPAETPPEQGFGLRRVRLILQGTLDERTSARVMVDPSVLAVSDAGAAPFRGVPLVEASIDYRLGAAATVRAGQQRLPFGLAASTAATSLVTPEYPLAPRLLMQRVSAFRDIGVALAGQSGPFEYGAGVFGGSGINVRRDHDSRLDVIARAAYALVPGVTLGLNGWLGHSGALYEVDGAPRRSFYDQAAFTRWGVDARVARGPVRLSAEYLADRTEHSAAARNPTPGGGALHRSGWYLQADARPLPRLGLAARYDTWSGATPADAIDEVTGGVSWHLSERTAPDDPRRGRPQNAVQRSSRLMAFTETARTGGGEWKSRLRLRWEILL